MIVQISGLEIYAQKLPGIPPDIVNFQGKYSTTCWELGELLAQGNSWFQVSSFLLMIS